MNIPPDHIFQEIDSDNCGPCCLEMVYKAKGIKRNVADILRDFHFGPKGGVTYPPQLALDLKKHGVKTRLTMSNPRVIAPAWMNLSKPELIENLKKWLTLYPKHEWHMFGLHVLFYLLDGGEFLIKSYTVEDLKQMIKNGSWLGLGLDEVWLWGHRIPSGKNEIDDLYHGSYGHFVLVKEMRNDKFVVSDPFPANIPGKCGIYEVSGEELLNASLIWSATIIEILK